MAYPNSDGEGQVIRNGSARPLSAVQQMDQSHPNMTPQGWDAFFGVTGGTPRGDQWYAQHEELTAVLQQVLRLLEKLEEAKNTGLEPSLVSSLHSYVDVARTKQTELGVEDRVGSMLDNWAEQWKKAQPDSPLLAGLDSFWHSGGAQTVGGVVPGIGESMDLEVLLDDDADGIDKILAGLSLVVSGLTLGAAPNFGGALRHADEALGVAEDAAMQGRRLTGYSVQAHTGDVLGQVNEIALERLTLAGQIEIPAGTQGIRKLMSDLSVVSGNEVALVRSESGRRFLVMGGPNAIRLPPYVAKIIAHTHPKGRLRFSDADLRSLRKRGQRSSVIISPWDDFGIRLPVGEQ